MTDHYPETCPLCKGWVYHRPEPCACVRTNPVSRVVAVADRPGAFEMKVTKKRLLIAVLDVYDFLRDEINIYRTVEGTILHERLKESLRKLDDALDNPSIADMDRLRQEAKKGA